MYKVRKEECNQLCLLITLCIVNFLSHAKQRFRLDAEKVMEELDRKKDICDESKDDEKVRY